MAGTGLQMTNSTRRAVVHIGHEKTGSTSLQHALAQDAQGLKTAGILLPKSPGALNHTRLVTACMDEDVVDNIKSHQMTQRGLNAKQLRRRFEKRFGQELDQAGNWHTLVITSELITSRLHTEFEVTRLLTLLQSHVDEIEVVLFLRRQDRLAVSRFSSALRAGFDDFNGIFQDHSGYLFRETGIGRSTDDMCEYFDYGRILRRFEGRAGVSLRVALYDGAGGEREPRDYFYKLLAY